MSWSKDYRAIKSNIMFRLHWFDFSGDMTSILKICSVRKERMGSSNFSWRLSEAYQGRFCSNIFPWNRQYQFEISSKITTQVAAKATSNSALLTDLRRQKTGLIVSLTWLDNQQRWFESSLPRRTHSAEPKPIFVRKIITCFNSRDFLLYACVTAKRVLGKSLPESALRGFQVKEANNNNNNNNNNKTAKKKYSWSVHSTAHENFNLR